MSDEVEEALLLCDPLEGKAFCPLPVHAERTSLGRSRRPRWTWLATSKSTCVICCSSQRAENQLYGIAWHGIALRIATQHRVAWHCIALRTIDPHIGRFDYPCRPRPSWRRLGRGGEEEEEEEEWDLGEGPPPQGATALKVAQRRARAAALQRLQL